MKIVARWTMSQRSLQEALLRRRNFWAYRFLSVSQRGDKKGTAARTLRGGGKSLGGVKFSAPSRIILLHWVKKLGLTLVRCSKSRVTFGFQQILSNLSSSANIVVGTQDQVLA